jgi:hypothetical protein
LVVRDGTAYPCISAIQRRYRVDKYKFVLIHRVSDFYEAIKGGSALVTDMSLFGIGALTVVSLLVFARTESVTTKAVSLLMWGASSALMSGVTL